MHARSTTLIADPTRMDEGIADIRDTVMPAVLDMDGCMGLSMLSERGSGRCIITTACESEEAMAATRDRVREMREQATERFGAREAEVHEWEIASMHRLRSPGEDACARVTWTRAEPYQIDRVVSAFRTGLIPRMDSIPGFCSLRALVDRTTGRSSVTAVYADRDAMARSLDQVRGMREDFSRQLDLEVTEVAQFDLVLHHLRVPELV